MFLRTIICGLLIGLSASAPLSACPLCKEAISTPDGSGETNNLPAAYNNSIYLMIAVPYISLGLLGFMIHRGLKKNADYFARLQTSQYSANNS